MLFVVRFRTSITLSLCLLIASTHSLACSVGVTTASLNSAQHNHFHQVARFGMVHHSFRIFLVFSPFQLVALTLVPSPHLILSHVGEGIQLVNVAKLHPHRLPLQQSSTSLHKSFQFQLAISTHLLSRNRMLFGLGD